MEKILSVISSLIIIIVFVYIYTKKHPIVLDANGFPSQPKLGDTFTKNGVVYVYGSQGWVVQNIISQASAGLIPNASMMPQIFPKIPFNGQLFTGTDGITYFFSSLKNRWFIQPLYPIKPTINQSFVDSNGFTWKYDGFQWNLQ